MHESNVYLMRLLEDYRCRLKEQRAELSRLPRGSLGFRNVNGKTSLVHIRKRNIDGKRKYIRKSINGNEKMIAQLARKKYLKVSIRLLTEDIALLEDLLKKHVDPTAGNILKMLPDTYRTIPEEMFFPDQREMKQWANESYEHNNMNPHEKIHITSRGLRVRSKSELLIAEKLDAYNISYRYEPLIHFNNHTFSPDFELLIKISRGSDRFSRIITKYWEHCGMMSDPRYRASNKWKLDQYEKIGIVPWKNLIITYDTEDGGINTGIIESEIINKILIDM